MVPTPSKEEETGQSVQAPKFNTLHLDNVFRVVSVLQQIMIELNGAVSKEAKVLAITKTVFNLRKDNDK
jgi:hypothetical protein